MRVTHFEITPRRACPQCLAEAAYHRSVWDISAYRACAFHGTRLISACSDCGHEIGWGHPDIDECHSCGRRVSSLTAPAASEGEVAVAQSIANLLERVHSDGYPFREGMRLILAAQHGQNVLPVEPEQSLMGVPA